LKCAGNNTPNAIGCGLSVDGNKKNHNTKLHSTSNRQFAIAAKRSFFHHRHLKSAEKGAIHTVLKPVLKPLKFSCGATALTDFSFNRMKKKLIMKKKE
jgi:hypothetical protein